MDINNKKICSIICSFNSPKLTDRVYKELLENEKHDIFILENSSSEDKMYKDGNVIDMGRENLGFGGMNNFIWQDKRFREYDFVGIYNNDIFNIPKDYITKIKQYLEEDIGMISSAINDNGTGWSWMRRVHKDGAREVRHVETIATFFNTKIFDLTKKYIPFQHYGIIDIEMSQLCKMLGYKTVVIDDITIDHMLSGARVEFGMQKEYLENTSKATTKWHNEHPELMALYNEYIKEVGNQLAVIIPNYNHNHLLRRSIESVVNSGVKADIIVVDDCSDESPYELIKDLPIQFFRHDKNRGLSQSRNTGISNTMAKWIIPLDADDEFLHGGLEALWNSRDKGDVIYGNLVWRDSSSQNKPSLQRYQEQIPQIFEVNNQIFGTSLYKRECWLSVGGYWEEHKEFYEDWDFWGRVAKKGHTFYYIDSDIYLYAGKPGGMCDRLGKNREYNVKLTVEHIKQS